MQHDRYQDLVTTPEAHAAFLESITPLVQACRSPEEAGQRLGTAISVEGKPFSPAKHLLSLETRSDAWDVDDMAPHTVDRIVRATASIVDKMPSYDLPYFTQGFHLYVSNMAERGVETPVLPKQTNPSTSTGEHTVSVRMRM